MGLTTLFKEGLLGNAQELFLTLHSGITPGGTLRTIWDIMYGT